MSEGKTDRDAKHVLLNDAIVRLEAVLQDAEKLYAEISYDGRDDPDNNDMNKSEPTLEEVLNNAPGQIDSHTANMETVLTNIRNSLF